MLKNILTAVLIIVLAAVVPAGAKQVKHQPPVKEEDQIIKVVKGAVEDTSWLRASSREEMEHILSAYFTGDLLAELSDSGWTFVSCPNSWEYTTSAGRVDVEVISRWEGTAQAEIFETDEISGSVYTTSVRYSLIKNSGGWKIRARALRMN